jgi:hypothetical protein
MPRLEPGLLDWLPLERHVEVTVFLGIVLTLATVAAILR